MKRKLNTGALCAFAIGVEYLVMVSRGDTSLSFAWTALFVSATLIWLGLESLKKYGILLRPKK